MDSLSNVFQPIYEIFLGLYKLNFTEIYDYLYNNGIYVKFGVWWIIIPLICYVIFYFIWKYPYGKTIHWIVMLFISALIVFGVTYGISNFEIQNPTEKSLEVLYNMPDSTYLSHAQELPIKYATYSALLSLLTGFIWSLLLKQFSKIHLHLPF